MKIFLKNPKKRSFGKLLHHRFFFLLSPQSLTSQLLYIFFFFSKKQKEKKWTKGAEKTGGIVFWFTANNLFCLFFRRVFSSSLFFYYLFYYEPKKSGRRSRWKREGRRKTAIFFSRTSRVVFTSWKRASFSKYSLFYGLFYRHMTAVIDTEKSEKFQIQYLFLRIGRKWQW